MAETGDIEPAASDDSTAGGADAGEAMEFLHVCPSCGEGAPLPGAGGAGGLIECPACGAQSFVVAAGSQEAEEWAQTEADAAAENQKRELELSALRIQQVATLRRSLNRTRSYFVLGAVASATVALTFVWYAVKYVLELRLLRSQGQHVGATAYDWLISCILGSIAATLGARAFYRRMRRVDVELAESLLHDPQSEPDFSTLSDGSHLWKDLEQMHAERVPETGALEQLQEAASPADRPSDVPVTDAEEKRV